MKPTQISAADISGLLAGGAALVDLAPDESFALAHLPEAKNACVYGVDFLQRCAEIAPDRSQIIVIYGTSSRSRATTTAAEKLAAAGYSQIREFPGGIEEWVVEGRPLEADESDESARSIELSDGRWVVDATESLIRWSGRNFNSVHTGTLQLRRGHLDLARNTLKEAAFEIDMKSLANDDVENGEMRQVLIDHLASDDFFDVGQHPVSTFEAAVAVPINRAREDAPNFYLAGRLSLKGTIALVSFPLQVAFDEGELRANGVVEIDRTRWGVSYGSNRFYESLAKHFVSDLIGLEVDLVARPA